MFELLPNLGNFIAGTGAISTFSLLYRDQILQINRTSWLEQFSFVSIDLTNGDIIALTTAVLTIFFAAYGNWDKIRGTFKRK